MSTAFYGIPWMAILLNDSDSRAVGLWKADGGAVHRQVAVLKVNDRLANDIVRAEQIVILDADIQVFVDRERRLQLKHAAQKT